MDQSSISIYIDDETSPFAQLDAPVSFELDTRQMPEGWHVLKIVSHAPDGSDEISLIDFEVKNRPLVAIGEVGDNDLVNGVLPLIINADRTGGQPRFIITGCERSPIIPFWLWLVIIGVAVWGAYSFIAFIMY